MRLGSTLEYWLRLSQKILSEGTSAHLEPPGRKIVRDSGNFLTLPAHLGLIVIIHAKGACLHWFHAFCSWFQISIGKSGCISNLTSTCCKPKMKTKTFFFNMLFWWFISGIKHGLVRLCFRFRWSVWWPSVVLKIVGKKIRILDIFEILKKSEN